MPHETHPIPRMSNRPPHPQYPPFAFYIVTAFLFILPLGIAGIRVLGGRAAFAGDEHLDAAFVYTPFALGLIASMWEIGRRPARGIRIAAWVISIGTLILIGRMGLVVRESRRESHDLFVECTWLALYLALGAFANAFAWRTDRRWRD